MAFATEDDLIAFRQEAVDSDAAELALEIASAAIVEYVGWSVEEETTTYTTDGDVKAVFLPTLRLTAVDSVVEDGTTLTSDDDYTWTTNGIVRRYPAGSYFTSGVATVTVTYTHGYASADIPAIFKAVCLQLANRMYGNPEQLRSETVGGISEGYVVTAAGYSWGPSLMPSEQNLLARYRLPSVA